MSTVFEMCGLMMARFYLWKMVATVQNYYMVKWDKCHVVLLKRKSILCGLHIFIQVWVRGQFGFIWN